MFCELRSVLALSEPSGSDLDYLFKLLVIGDSGYGKSSLLLSFTSDNAIEDLSPTIGNLFELFNCYKIGFGLMNWIKCL
uniref:Putative small GTPase superfamily, P-loop containing nucleoside triphosphate hydrolase n=1 Tax=Helianthus annuus TaxID=4232 RepID=A0A251TEV5_HELAN